MSGETASCFLHGSFDPALVHCPACEAKRTRRASGGSPGVRGGTRADTLDVTKLARAINAAIDVASVHGVPMHNLRRGARTALAALVAGLEAAQRERDQLAHLLDEVHPDVFDDWTNRQRAERAERERDAAEAHARELETALRNEGQCRYCRGSGRTGSPPRPCHICEGTGLRFVVRAALAVADTPAGEKT